MSLIFLAVFTFTDLFLTLPMFTNSCRNSEGKWWLIPTFIPACFYHIKINNKVFVSLSCDKFQEQDCLSALRTSWHLLWDQDFCLARRAGWYIDYVSLKCIRGRFCDLNNIVCTVTHTLELLYVGNMIWSCMTLPRETVPAIHMVELCTGDG